MEEKTFYIAQKLNNAGKLKYLNDFGEQYPGCCFFSEFPELGWKDPDEAIEYFAIVASHTKDVILVSKTENLDEKLEEYDSLNGLRSFEDIGLILNTTKQNASQITKNTMTKILKVLKRHNQNYSYYDLVYEMMKYFKIETEKEAEDFIKSFPQDICEKIKNSFLASLN